MFSIGKESTLSSSSTCDQQNTSDKVLLEVTIQGEATPSSLPHSSNRSPILCHQVPMSFRWKILTLLARDRPQKAIKKFARYATDDESGLITYVLAVVQQTPEKLLNHPLIPKK